VRKLALMLGAKPAPHPAVEPVAPPDIAKAAE